MLYLDILLNSKDVFAVDSVDDSNFRGNNVNIAGVGVELLGVDGVSVQGRELSIIQVSDDDTQTFDAVVLYTRNRTT